MTRFNTDIEKHAADKVRRALMDVYQLTDDPSQMMRIALTAASVCIGQAGGFLAGSVKKEGGDITFKDATVQILELLKLNTTEGPDAVMTALGEPQ